MSENIDAIFAAAADPIKIDGWDKGLTTGRVVHFSRDDGSQHFAALVAHVWQNGLINIGYFGSAGEAMNATSVPYSDLGGPFSWHWPERA
jgi:hypothetical protein